MTCHKDPEIIVPVKLGYKIQFLEFPSSHHQAIQAGTCDVLRVNFEQALFFFHLHINITNYAVINILFMSSLS